MKYNITSPGEKQISPNCPFCGYQQTRTLQFTQEDAGTLTHTNITTFGVQCCKCRAVGPLADLEIGANNGWEYRHSEVEPKSTTIVNPRQITLEELISTLKMLPEDRPIVMGLSTPHSYRGFYEQLAFQLQSETSAKHMLEEARKAMDTFPAWKGGNYTMRPQTLVWVATIGQCGWPLTDALLAAMLAGTAV